MDPLEQLGIKSIRPKQKPVIDSLLSGRDTLVVMPTGSGKSLCYQYPALKMDGTAIVVSPLIALMKDQVDSLKAKGVPAEFINSSLNSNKKKEILKKLQMGTLKLLYVSPEALQSEAFFSVLNRAKPSFFAIDEAHCISTWGHDFRKSYRSLMHIKAEFPNKPIIALTATATFETRKDIIGQLDLNCPNEFVYSFDRPNLKLSVLTKSRHSIMEIILNYKIKQTIIYGFSKSYTEIQAATINNLSGFQIRPFVPYHAGLKQARRTDVQNSFMRGEINIVATKAFGMGIDNPNVELVLHNNVPPTLEDYYQEAGRAGRNGDEAHSIILFDMNSMYKMDCFLERQHGNTGHYGIMHEKLMKVGLYCTSRNCRRKALLEYLGEEYNKDNCGSCDVCMAKKGIK